MGEKQRDNAREYGFFLFLSFVLFLNPMSNRTKEIFDNHSHEIDAFDIFSKSANTMACLNRLE